MATDKGKVPSHGEFLTGTASQGHPEGGTFLAVSYTHLDVYKRQVKEEFVLLNQLSDEKEEIDEEKIESITKGIINWVDNDVDYFKRQYADFQEKLRQFLEEEDKSNISVASPELLKQLESLKGENPKKNKNNFIIP